MKSSDTPVEALLLPAGRPAPRRGRVAVGLLLRLAWLDLWHERVLTACVMVALTAVLAPLLILLSLKHGLVETLRARLVTDPRNREIRPQTSEQFTFADIESLRQRPDVRFVIPMTRSISSNVQVSLPDSPEERLDTEIVPTGDGDPLLEENGTRAPGLTECVLSSPLAHRLGAGGTVGSLRVQVVRQSKSGSETASVVLTVVGRASERATSREAVFVPLEFLEQIESWLEGNPVPALGWTGDAKGIVPVAEEVIVPTTRPLEAVEQAALLVNTGFSEMKELTKEDVSKVLSVPEGMAAYYQFITSAARRDDPVDASALKRFRSSLPPVAGDIYGYCRPISLRVRASDGQTVQTAVFHVRPEVMNSPVRKTAPAVPPPRVPPADTTVRPALPGPPITVPSPSPVPAPSEPPPAPKPAAGGFKFDTKVAPIEPPVPPPVKPAEPKSKDAEAKSKAKGEDKQGTKPKGKNRLNNEQTQHSSAAHARYVQAAAPPSAALPIITVPDQWQWHDGDRVAVAFDTPSGEVSFPATVAVGTGSEGVISQRLAGALRVGLDRPIDYDATLGAFVPTRRGWPSFRLVAKDIDSVQGLVDYFHSRRMNVITRADRIRDVRELDRYTTHVFWIVAGVGLTGAVGALLASLIASVERKRRSLGVLRLLGLKRRSLVRLPFYQSAIVVSGSVGLAIAAWWWVSRFIEQFTVRYLDAGEALATMPMTYLLLLWGGALLVAAFASCIAGIRVMQVDPSEAIRDE